MAALTSILVPVDGSAPSIAALEHAVALAADCGAKVEMFHVSASETFGVGSRRPLSPNARQESDVAVADAFERAARDLGDRVTRRTVFGDPLRSILEEATSGDFDLVVLGTHGSIGRIHAILGSVAEGVIRSAPCPVLTVREPGEAYQSFSDRVHRTPSLAEQVNRGH